MTPDSGYIPLIPTSQRLRFAKWNSDCVACESPISIGDKCYIAKTTRWFSMCVWCGPFPTDWEASANQ